MVVLVAATLLAACGGEGTPATPTARTSTPPPVSDSLSDSVSEPACTTAELRITWKGIAGGLGHAGLVLLFENTGGGCVLRGYPGVDGVDGQGNVTVQAGQTPNGYLGGPDTVGSEAAAIVLATGQVASALIEGSGPVSGDACPRYEALLVTPPGETSSVRLLVQSSFCHLEVHPVVVGATGDASAPGSDGPS